VTNLQGIAFFIADFVFDMLMLGRVDSWHVIGQQIVYLAVITVVLVQMFREEDTPSSAPEAPRSFRSELV
jgi:hypothetical protein